MTSPKLPLYVDFPGEPVAVPPLAQMQSRIFAFVIPADRRALETLCRRYFDEPTGGVVRAVPMGSFVILLAADVGAAYEAEGPLRGKVPEIDIGFWVPIRRETVVHGQRERAPAWFL